ncbi:hypothetical protein [Streptomyces sp. 1222.5]|uniref:hypothetical protein n=1 Tax=Streptomyces sp. 1222.5 TaxID=1881026 RepID=UPI003EB6B094
MTSDRHLALLALMNEITAPAKIYDHCLRRAAAERSDSPEYDAAVDRGSTALDLIERAVRLWVENNAPRPVPGRCGVPSPDGRFVCALPPHGVEELHADRSHEEAEPNGRRMVWSTPTVLPDGFARHSCITVACAVCGYRYDEAEFDRHFPSVGDAIDGAVSSGWDELKDGRLLCEADDDKHDALRRTVGVADDDAEPTVRVFHSADGWALPDYTDLADCTTNFHRAQDGRPACTETAVWKVVEQRGLNLTIAWYCDGDLPAEHRPLATPAA